MRKWNKMVARQKDVQDQKNKSGNSRKIWKYYDELSQCFSEEASINPVRTMESSLDVQLDNHLECEQLDGSTSDPDGISNLMVHLLPLQRRRKGVASDQPADLQQLKC